MTLMRLKSGQIPRLCGLAALAIGLATLAAWWLALPLPLLTQHLPGLPAMPVTSALLAALSGLALLIMARPSRRASLLPRLLALAVMAISLQSLVEDSLTTHFHLNEMLQHWVSGGGMTGEAHPCRQSASCFFLLGLALLLTPGSSRRCTWLAQGLAIATVLIILTAATGYLYSVSALYLHSPDNPLRGVSLPAGLAMALLALGLLFLHPGRGPMALLNSAGPGGHALRRLLPWAILLPLSLMLFLLHGVQTAFLGIETGTALVALIAILVTLGLLLWNAIQQDSRQSEEHARGEAEHRFNTVYDNVADAIFFHDLNGRFLSVNQVACERLGYSREELLQRSPRDIDTPEFAAQVPLRVEALQRKGQIVFESAHLTRTGRRIPVEISSRLITFDGRPAVISVARDLSPRKAMEAAERRAAAAMQALLDASGESAFLLNHDSTILALNETAARRFGHSREAMLGRDVFSFMPEDVATSRRAQTERVFASGQPVQFSDERQGRRFDIAINPVANNGNGIEQVAVYAADVTERRQLRSIDELFHDIDRKVLGGASLHDLLVFVCTELCRLFDLGYVWIGSKQPGGRVDIEAGAGPSEGYRQALEDICVRWDLSLAGSGPVGLAIRTGQPQTFRIDDPGLRPWREAARQHNLQSIQCLPLIVRGEVYGVLALYGEHPDSFMAEGTIGRLAGVADRVCVALEAAMGQEQLRLLGDALATAGNAVFITDDKGRIEWVNPAFGRITGYSQAEVLGQTPRLLNSGVQSAAYFAQLWETIRSGVTWSGETVEKRKDGQLFTVHQTITPIRRGDGEIGHYLSILEDITARKEAEARIQHMAHFDALTDLPNRFLFEDRLHQAVTLARRGEHSMALLFIDLDRFKEVNDSYGHHVGDLLLQEVAHRLNDCVRESDTVARLAGDEFTVLVPDCAAQADAEAVAEKIVAALRQPYLLDGKAVKSSACVGIALAPRDARDADALLKLADAAMYRAKQAGQARWACHEG